MGSQTTPKRKTLLVRFSGDITTKAESTRRRFLLRMVRNIKDALKTSGSGHTVNRTRDRIFVSLNEEYAESGAADLRRVFGVQSLAPVQEIHWDSLDDLIKQSEAFFRNSVRERSFAVRARRIGAKRSLPFRSVDVERALGTALLPGAAKVNLRNPDVTVALELTPQSAYLFEERLTGPGGVPLGVESRAVSLMSGGFDSPVAAWLLMKRGVALDFVLCNLGGRQQLLETLAVCKELADRWSFGTRPHLHVIDFDGITRSLQDHVSTRFWQVILKRFMMRAAQAVAEERDAQALITGEVVAQVSSQTLPNLAVISSATDLPILRPLVGFNKEEIIRLAREIGTHDLSAQVGEYCALVPSRPATRTSQARAEAEEADIDPQVLQKALDERVIYDLRALDLESLNRLEIRIDHVPEGAIVLDLRSKQAYQNWHYPNALFLDFANALRVYAQMDATKEYVLYCEFGLKSGHMAELMRKQGLRASHFSGGLSALVSYLKSKGLPPTEV